MPLDLLCSQMFYLDDSITFQSENNKERQNNNKNIIEGKKTKDNFILFKSQREEIKQKDA